MRLGQRAKETHAGKVSTPCFKDRGPLFRMTDWWGWEMEEKRRQAAALQEIRHSYLTGIVKELREINRDFALPSKGPEVEVAGFSRKAKRFEKAATRKDQILPPAGMNSECGNQTLGPKMDW